MTQETFFIDPSYEDEVNQGHVQLREETVDNIKEYDVRKGYLGIFF